MDNACKEGKCQCKTRIGHMGWHRVTEEEEAEEKELCLITMRSPEQVASDIINPPHYKVGGIDTYDFIRAKGLSYTAGQVIKYITRYEHKNGLEDLNKAKWYLDKLISEIGGKSQKAVLDERVGYID